MTRRIPAEGRPSGIAVGAGSVWTSNTAEGTVSRIDPGSNAVVQTVPVGNGPDAIAFGDGAVWVANSLGDTVSRIDPATNNVAAAIPVGEGLSGVAVAPGVVLVASEFAETVSRVDPRTNTVARSTPVANRPQGLAMADRVAWVGVAAGGAAHSGGTLLIVNSFDLPTIPMHDPAVSYAWPVTSLTGDGLVALRRIGGTAGARIVPDLAKALPAPTGRGKTYTFQLRPGIRYATGAVVRLEDARRAIERVYELRGPGTVYYTGIVGAPACAKRKGRCDLKKGIATDDAAGTISFHLVAPDPDFLYKLALPFTYVVPAHTPSKTISKLPLPATGPYVIRRDTKEVIELVSSVTRLPRLGCGCATGGIRRPHPHTLSKGKGWL